MRNEMDYLLRKINMNIFTYSDENQIQVEYSWLCSESNTQKIHFCILVAHFSSFVAGVNTLFDHFVLDEPKSFLYPCWTPWNSEEYFIATFLMQIVLGLGPMWIMFSTQLFIVFVAIEFSRQNTRLCAALTSIHQRTENAVSMKIKNFNKNNTNEQKAKLMENLMAVEFENNLKQCILHHQILMK